MWMPPDSRDRVIDLRNLESCGTPEVQQGYALIATPRDPLPGETLLAGAFNDSLSAKANDALKNALQIPEALAAPTLPDLINLLLGIYSDPSVGLICPPLIPDRSGNIRCKLGEIAFAYRCPTVGTQWENILKVLQADYRAVKQSPDTPNDLHRKMLAVWQRKYGIENHEVFIPSDLPKETPVKPTTTINDTFDVGNHVDLSGQASSDGWTWNKIEGNAQGLFRTNTQVYAECASVNNNRCHYRADQDLSSTDHYVQGSCMNNTGTMFTGLFARKDSSATLTNYDIQLRSDDDLLRIRKRVSGTITTLQDNAHTANNATFYLIKFVVNGTTLQSFVAGSQVGTDLTDSAISAGLRCGIAGICNHVSLPEVGGIENFEASDELAVGGPLFRPALAHSVLTRGRLNS